MYVLHSKIVKEHLRMKKNKDELLDDFDIEGIEALGDDDIAPVEEESEKKEDISEIEEDIPELDEMDIEDLEDMVEEELPASENIKGNEPVGSDEESELEESENNDTTNEGEIESTSEKQAENQIDNFSMLEIEEDEEELSYAEKISREEEKTKSKDVVKEALFEKDDKLGGERIDRELVIVTDRPTLGLINYFRDNNVNVNTLFSSLEKAREKLMLQVEPCRVVILDTGLGKFSSMTERQVLSDILSFCDESFRISVFYCDLALKSDTMRSSYIKDKSKLKKIIDWHKFVNTADVVRRLLKSNETYIDGKNRKEDDEVNIDISDLDQFKPEETEYTDVENNSKFNIGTINIDEISTKTSSLELKQIESYKIKI